MIGRTSRGADTHMCFFLMDLVIYLSCYEVFTSLTNCERARKQHNQSVKNNNSSNSNCNKLYDYSAL